MLYLNIYLILYWINFFIKIYSLDVVINNDENTMYNIADNINKQSVNNEIRMIFNDERYKIPSVGKNTFYVQNNLNFYSEKGAIFDFQGLDKGTIHFHFNNILPNRKVTFQNIIFDNYNGYSTGGHLIYLGGFDDESNRYTIEFKNCTFNNIKNLLFNTELRCTKALQTTPQMIFNNCKFL